MNLLWQPCIHSCIPLKKDAQSDVSDARVAIADRLPW